MRLPTLARLMRALADRLDEPEVEKRDHPAVGKEPARIVEIGSAEHRFEVHAAPSTVEAELPGDWGFGRDTGQYL